MCSYLVHLLIMEFMWVQVLVDPIPEVRTVASRALGSLIKGMGDDNFKDLVPWLLQTLKSETSSVERSGAAQGLSEVFMMTILRRLCSCLLLELSCTF